MNKESWASLIRLAGELVKDYGKTLQGSALDLEPENWAKESFSLAK